MNTRISHSEVETYNTCERKHFYQYAEKLEPLRESRALVVGTLFHEYCEKYFKCVQSLQESGQFSYEEKEKLVTQISLEFAEKEDDIETFTILKNYLRLQVLDSFRVMSVEQHFVCEISPGVDLSFKVDLIVQDNSGRFIIVDHKTVQNPFKDYELKIKPQLVLYLVALLKGGYPVDGVAYSQIKKKPAKTDTDADIYVYKELEVTEKRKETAQRELVNVAKRIGQRRSNPEFWEQNTTRNTGNCTYCIFRDLCSADNMGKDNEALALRTMNFKVSTRGSSTDVIQF